MPIANVNGINIYFEVHGVGEPLLMIQGLGFEISSMVTEPGRSRYLDKFAAGYRVIVYDCRGVGRTDKPDVPYTIEMMADDAVGLMDALGISKAHIMGTSMGSQTAQIIAAKYPERVISLILVVGFSRALPVMRFIGIAATMIPGVKEKMTGWVYEQRYPPTPASFKRMTGAANRCDTRPLLGRIKCPVLIVSGKNDKIIPMKITRELVGGILKSKLVLVDGDHLFSATNPDLLITPALSFLSETGEKNTTSNRKPC